MSAELITAITQQVHYSRCTYNNSTTNEPPITAHFISRTIMAVCAQESVEKCIAKWNFPSGEHKYCEAMDALQFIPIIWSSPFFLRFVCSERWRAVILTWFYLEGPVSTVLSHLTFGIALAIFHIAPNYTNQANHCNSFVKNAYVFFADNNNHRYSHG